MTNEEKTLAFEEALQDFDFERVEQVMHLLKWEWFMVGVPSPTRMVKTCHLLFEELLKDPTSKNCASGGFKVLIGKDYVSIEFIVEDSTGGYLDKTGVL